MRRRAFLGGTAASAVAFGIACVAQKRRGGPPLVQGIQYADRDALPPTVALDPRWIEHRIPYANASAAYQWSDVILEAAAREVDAIGVPRPTVISRYMAIACTAMYDAWAAYDARAVGTRLGDTLRRPVAEHTVANKSKAIAFATYHALLDLFPKDSAWLTEQMRALGHDPATASKDPTSPEAVGLAAATALVAYRHRDGANALGDEVGGDGAPYGDYTGYEPRNPLGAMNDADRWQPIEFDDGKGGKIVPGFLTPQWYRVQLLALARSDQFRPGPQPKVGSPQLRRELEEVIAFNGGLSLEQKSIVEFMRDGPRSTGQSGHWLHFAQDISRRDDYDLDGDVKLMFAVSNVAFEAFIAAWDAKRFYDSARPFALVHRLFANNSMIGYLGPGKGFGVISGERWHPYSPGTFVSPPFPGYVSGHSTVSGACAKMLERFTGADRFGVYHRHVAGMNTEPDARVAEMQSLNGVPARGLPEDKKVVIVLRTFTQTSEMAGISRVMGGYHIQSDNVEGLRLGRSVAEYVWPRYRAYFEGTATVRA